MEKPSPIYLTGYVSKEDLKAFRDGYSGILVLWTSWEKGKMEDVELKVPLSYVYTDEEGYYYINRGDFANQF